MDPLKSLLDSMKARIKELKKELKAVKKLSDSSRREVKLNNEIYQLEQFSKRFSPSKMHPVQIGSIVINYKLYQDFIKKLKGFFITEEVKDGTLILKYYKGNINGELVLEDLTHFFPEGSVFPIRKLQEVSVL